MSWRTTIITMLGVVSLCEPALSHLVVTPFMMSSLPGKDVQFVCSIPNNQTLTEFLRWTMPNITDETADIEIPTSGRIQAVNGTLTIFNITFKDAGTYTCNNEFDNKTETGVLQVYEDPDYLVEGLIIAAICLALLLLLALLIVLSSLRQQRQRKWRLLEAENRQRKTRGIKQLNTNH